MASIKGVLTNYFKQLHFNAMSPEVRARWEDYLANGDLVDNMKDWAKDLMHEDPVTHKKVNNALPDIFAALTEDQIKELYKACNDAFIGMHEDSKLKSENYSGVKKFVDDFYGVAKPFHSVGLSNVAQTDLEQLQADGTLATLESAINSLINDYGLKDKITFDQLIDAIQTKKYNTDQDFKNAFKYIFENISSQQYKFPEITRAVITRFQNIAKGFDYEPTGADIASFKDRYNQIFYGIYKTGKIKEVFSEHDRGYVTKALNSALDVVDYNKSDKASYIPPKIEDERAPLDQIKKWVADSYENNLKKYATLRGDRMFFSEPARLICKGIDKENIKPTDGIDAVLKKADDIKKHMANKSKAADLHFEWFVKEMNSLKKSMPDAFKGALRNGPQLRRIITQLILDAVETGKVKEAKTAMEILSVIKYANTTSKIMDTIKGDKELFTFFSNKDLSWNKNEGVQFITKALDKSVRAAFLGVGYGITIGVNLSRKSRSKIRPRNKHNELSKAEQEWQAKVDADKADMQRVHDRAQNRKMFAENFVNSARPQQTIQNDIQQWTSRVSTTQQAIEPYIKRLKAQLQAMLADPALVNDADTRKIQDYIEAVENALSDDQLYNIQKPQLASAAFAFQSDVDDIDANLQIMNTQQQRLDTKKTELSDLLEATDVVNNATQQITDTEAKLQTWDADHKNKYQELIDHWNKLETGRDTHTGEMYSWRPGNAEKKQKAFWNRMGGRGI